MNINQASLLNTFSGQSFSRPQTNSAKNNVALLPSNAASKTPSNSINTSNETSVTFSNTGKNTDTVTMNTYSKASVTNTNNKNNKVENSENNSTVNTKENIDSKTTETTEQDESKQKAIKVEEDKKNSLQLSEENVKVVQELKKRDQEVRTHEAAHLAAAGKYATSGASFDYQRGPDGKNYAVGGEVGIDSSPIPNDPQATLQKAQQIRAAAQAPANPSSQDRQVAASATQMEVQARQEIVELTLGEKKGAENFDASASVKNNSNGNNNNSSNAEENSAQSSKSINTIAQSKAASTYQAVGDISQKTNEAASLIKTIA